MKRKHKWEPVGHRSGYEWCANCGMLRYWSYKGLSPKYKLYYRKPKNMVAPRSASPNPSSLQFSKLEEVTAAFDSHYKNVHRIVLMKEVIKFTYDFIVGKKVAKVCGCHNGKKML